MRLTDFIQENKEEIAYEWVLFAQDNIQATQDMERDSILDHIMQMLDRIVNDMESPQNKAEQKEKSRGNKPAHAIDDLAAVLHGAQRVEAGFDIVELSSEFRALRASVLRLWEEKMGHDTGQVNFQDMIRFNEAIDEAWMHSMARFHTKIDESKNWFLGILGHDLRNPLAAVKGVNQILSESPELTERDQALLQRSDTSIKRMEELINNLLELTNLRLGGGLSIKKTPAELSKQCEQIVQEFQIAYPKSEINLESLGPVAGNWDLLRINQVITNLVANALRYGKQGGPVSVKVFSDNGHACFSVHNLGNPIQEEKRRMIFTGLYTESEGRACESSYGIGLYVVNEIIKAHEGDLQLESNQEKGTTFTITLPR
ncbi:sensor histidine kinase [Catalinimonas sp. 4WD22]|uniref:sensor histidine kinase n=1 Tax=Catalinimonas locisalis TaxID=3133978 RepID=UPI0031014D47